MRIVRLAGVALAGGILVAACSGGGGGDELPAPVLTGIAPASGPVGGAFTLTGTDFGPDASEVFFDGAISAAITSWSDTSITATVPATTGGPHSVTVSHGGGVSSPQTFTVLLPAAVYVYDDVTQVFGFTVSATGVLTATPGSPYPTGGVSAGFGGDADSLQVHTATGRVYATTTTALAAWNIDAVTGALLQLAGSPFPVAGSARLFGVAVNNAGDRVFLPDYNTGNVHVMDTGGATITQLAASPFAATDVNLDVPKLTSAGAFLYVNDETGDPSALQAFSVTPAGALTELASSPYGYFSSGSLAQGGMEISPQDRLYVPEENGVTQNILIYDIAGDGTATENVGIRMSLPAAISGLEFSPDGSMLFAVERANSNVYVYDVTPATGALTEVAGSPFTLGSSLSVPETDDTGTLLFLANENPPELYVATVNGTGTVTPVGTPVPLTGEPSGMDFSR